MLIFHMNVYTLYSIMFIYGDKIECVNKLRPIKLSVFSVPHVKQTYSRIVMVVISDTRKYFAQNCSGKYTSTGSN